MHLVRYHLAISLDGFIAPTDGSHTWLDPYGSLSGSFMKKWVKQIGGLITGRATYDTAIGFGGWMFGDMPAVLMTNRPPEDLPKAIEVASGEPAPALARLRQRMGEAGSEADIWLFGGGVTAGRFLQAGLIDLIELAVIPVVLGEGKTLFSAVAVQETFDQAGVEPMGLGCNLISYRRIAKT